MSKRYTARDLQAAFVEGAKHEYEVLAKRFEAAATHTVAEYRELYRDNPKLSFLLEPFGERYNERKDRRYSEAAKTYPVKQVPRKLRDTGLHVSTDNYATFVESDGTVTDRTINGWRPEDFRTMADLLERPTEDAD